MTDLAKVKRNVSRLIEQGAPEGDIEAYLAGEGLNAADLHGGGGTPQNAQLSTAEDILKSAATGVQRGVTGLVGLPGDIIKGGRWLADKAGLPTVQPPVPGGAELQAEYERIGGPVHEPQTTAGEYARTAGEFAPAIATGPGGMVRRGMAQVLAPAAVSETAGQATKGTGAEPYARLVGALAGGVGGMAAGEAVNRARGYVPGMQAGAGRTLEKTLTPEAEARFTDLGPQAFLFEGTPGTMGVAQGIATRPGAAQNTLVGAVRGRQAGANARLTDELDATLGPAVAPSRIEASLEQQRQSMADLYEQVVGLNSPVNLTPVAERLRLAIPQEAGATQQALSRVLDMIAPAAGQKRVVRTSPREVLNVRQALDDELKRLGEQPKAFRAVTEYRRLVDEALGEAVPDLKVLDATYAGLMRESEALARGGQILNTGKTAIRPEDLMAERQAMNLPQREAQRHGARAEIDRLVGTKANDVTALKLLVQSEGDWNRVKLAEIFGVGEADRILKAVDREAAFQNAYNKLIENSMTAQRLQGAKLVEAETVPAQSLRDVTVPGMVFASGQKALQLLRQSTKTGRRASADEELARALTTAGPPRDALLRAIRSAQSRREKGNTETRDLLIQALIGSSAATTDARN